VALVGAAAVLVGVLSGCGHANAGDPIGAIQDVAAQKELAQGMADAFQPTDTERPATKKSLAVFDWRADQKPMPMVATTVTNEKTKIHGSTPLRNARDGSMGSTLD